MTPEHRLAIEIMSECGISRVGIVKDPGWYLDDAPTLGEVKAVLRKRHNQMRLLTLGRITMTVAEWAEARGIKPKTIYERLRQNWSVQEAINTPTRSGGYMV